MKDNEKNLSTEEQRVPFALTGNEGEVMETMWRENRPMSRSEIIEASPERSWKQSTIHLLLNSLLEKGAIEVCGFTRAGKTYGRTFAPTLSACEYAAMQLRNSYGFDSSSSRAIPDLVSALIDREDDAGQLILDLENMLEERKKGL